MPDYSQGKIYKLTCDTGKVYIGSTTEALNVRLNKHKIKKNQTASRDFINPKIELLEAYPCETKEQLCWKEREWFDKTECVNLNKPIITQEERLKMRGDSCRKWQANNKEHYDNYLNSIQEKRKERIECPCGITYTYANKARHLKTKKHLNYEASKE